MVANYKSKLIFVHIGKCGGRTLANSLRQSAVVTTKFSRIDRVHVRKPVYEPDSCYLFVLRNPVSRALSVFNWRKRLVENRANQKNRFKGEALVFQKYSNLNELAEKIYGNNLQSFAARRELRCIHHMKENINHYLLGLINKLDAKNIFAVFVQETLGEDIEKFLGVRDYKSYHVNNNTKSASNKLALSLKSVENLERFFHKDFIMIQKLNEICPIENHRLQLLLNFERSN